MTRGSYLKSKLGRTKWVSLASIVIVIAHLCQQSQTQAQAQSQDRGYGGRLNLHGGAIVTADFIDRDRDGVDDRYQRGPGQRPIEKKRLLLPHIEYMGTNKSTDLRELRYAVSIYESYHNLKSKMPSKLILSDEIVTQEMIEKIKNKKLIGTIFHFPDGLKVIKPEGPSQKLIIETDGIYNYYKYYNFKHDET
jgi:hypothetical protein